MHDHEHGVHAAQTETTSPHELRVRAIITLLMDKGLLSAEELRRTIEDMEARTPALGAKVVARAWVDPAFKARLLADAKAAIAELGIDTSAFITLKVVENTEKVHNVVVCTLCSCYPRDLLGVPPAWYKSLNYRARVVVDPRGVLKEFGLELAPDVEVRVYDSTADVRYLVLPQRPPGSEGLSEEALASLVTRDSMIGVARARTPAAD
ncbi:MAG: nitrile hydratase subunit alpha [Candidatus Tectimicrobiota bacterium]|nr:MAG: nitrile hydratase subunit alpha [Candidatus Tectomicrobia bacterium]